MALLLAPLDGRITLKGPLGAGGMGEVHRAWDAGLERPVAVKFIRGGDREEADRLLLEARLQARVDHSHVVKVHEVGTLGGRPCIVMQLVEGRSLTKLIPSLSLELKVELLKQVAEGLHAAHHESLVHRDIKPGNVLVEERPEGLKALVSDFGLARDQDALRSRSGLPAGTLDFMSPEQLLGQGPLDFRSDIYALGATLYSVLAQRFPFRESPRSSSGPLIEEESSTGTEDPPELLRRILEKEPRPLKLLVPGLPRELPLIVGKAMEKDPSLRYASAEAFAQDLGRFQRGEAILARRSPVAERLLRWSRRNRIAARALAVAALTILLGVGFALWISHRAGLEAIEAARLGAEAAAMREEVRAQHLAPPHDLRASRALLRQTLREIEGRPGVQKTGAGAYAIGTGRELLGDHGGARVAFEEAWQRGFRTPETAVALGEALARQYEQEVSQLSEYDGKIAQASHLAALDRQYAEPARRMLAQGPRGGWQEAYTRGRIALLARDFPLARKQAAEAFAAAPQRYEALMLEGEAWQREAHIALDNLDNQAALAALDRALVPLQRATAWGRSDPGLYELIAYVYRIRSTALLRLGRDPDPAVSEAERFTTLALTLDPDAWPVQMHLGVALQSRAAYLAAIAPKEAVAPIEASLTRLRRAAELAPSELEPLTNLAYGLYVLGVVQGNLGQSERAALEEGVQVAARATALAPDHGNVIFQQALLAQELGNSLREEGTDGSAALRTALAACERLLKMEGVIPAPIRTVLGATLTGLAREDWLAGRDPRANLARAVEVTELARREKPGDPAGAVDLANPINASAEMGLRIGDDVKSILRQGIAACDAVGKASDLGQVRVVRAELVAVEARRQLLTSENPLASITEARMILLGTKSFADEPDTLLTLAQLDLLEGAWRVHAGEDARPTLRAAEHRFQAMLREKPSWQGALDGLAAVFLWRSLDARAHGRPCAALAEAGLAPVQRALALDPRDASRRLLEARLLALSGHEAEAREAREAAAKANRLIRSGAEWKAAASEAGP